eukprot:2895386-Pyramimonas_sp.AAC.1
MARHWHSHAAALPVTILEKMIGLHCRPAWKHLPSMRCVPTIIEPLLRLLRPPGAASGYAKGFIRLSGGPSADNFLGACGGRCMSTRGQIYSFTCVSKPLGEHARADTYRHFGT